MELRHLRYFVAVAEEENVSRAALRLHVSQPALSRQIRDLEDELGLPLFQRSAKSVRLSEAGRVFLSEARAVLERVEEAVGKVRAVATGGSGELHIGYAMTPTVRMLPQALRAFQSELPNIRVKLHDLSTEEMFTGLREGKLHLAFMICADPSMLRGLNFEKLKRLPIRLAVAPEHPLVGRKTVPIEEIARCSLIAFNRVDYPDYHALLGLWFAGIKPKPAIAEEHDSVSSLIAAVEAGEGIAFVTESMAAVAGPRLKLLGITPAPRPLALAAVWPENGLSFAAERFLACARKASREK